MLTWNFRFIKILVFNTLKRHKSQRQSHEFTLSLRSLHKRLLKVNSFWLNGIINKVIGIIENAYFLSKFSCICLFCSYCLSIQHDNGQRCQLYRSDLTRLNWAKTCIVLCLDCPIYLMCNARPGPFNFCVSSPAHGLFICGSCPYRA